MRHPLLVVKIVIGVQTMQVEEESDAASSANSDERSTESSSDEASASEASQQSESEVDQTCWVLAKGAKGRLHFGSSCDLACGRRLAMPESGIGMIEAAKCGREWSPRCFARLPDKAKQLWEKLQAT